MHTCPGCGKQTEGSFKLDGVIIAACPGCKLKEMLEIRRQLDQDIKLLKQELAEDVKQGG